MRVAISGKSRAGKDTTAEFICAYISAQQEPYKCVSFAKALYDCTRFVQGVLGKPVEKDPKLLQFMGEGLRQYYGKDVFVNVVKSIIESTPSHESIIVTDLRYKNEYALLKDLGFTTIRVNRKDRHIDRDPIHISEIDLDDAEFDYVINNDGSLDDISNQAQAIVSKLI